MSFAQLWRVIGRVASLLREERAPLVLVVTCIVLDVSYGAFNALTFSKLVDLGVIAHDGVRFAWLLGVLGAAMLVAVSGGLFRDWLLARMGARVARRLREEMYAKLVGPSGGDLAHGPHGDVLYRFSNDVLAIENTIAGVLPALVRALIAIGINAAVLARERWWFAVTSIVLSLLALVAPRILARRSMEATRLRREAEQALLGEVGVALQATDVVRVLGLGESMVSKFINRCGEVFRRNVRATFLGFAMTRGSAIGMNIAEMLALGIFGAMAVAGHVSPGRFVALHSLFMELALAFLALTQLTPGFVDAHVSFERLRLLRDLPLGEDEKGEIAATFTKDLALSHIDVLYPDGKRGLTDVSLVLRKGEMVAIVGPSGSGKSTLARAVLGLAKTAKGEISFDGVPYFKLAMHSVRAQMGAVFQETVLFDCSIEENIRLSAPSATQADVERAIGAAGLTSLVNRPSYAPMREVGEGGVALSGGQRQRIGFARALVRDPQILVLDEPTSQLDPGNAQDITETICEQAAHRTVLVVTHDPRLAKRADRILVMDEGKLVAEGTHETLLQTSPLYRSLVEAAGTTSLAAS